MNKYHNRKTTVDGITFDSQKEAARFRELMLLQRAGKIRGLKLQPEFTLQEAFTTPDGERVSALKYRADFSYERSVRWQTEDGPMDQWVPVVEDVKGVRTEAYKLKKKLMLERGIMIEEV